MSGAHPDVDALATTVRAGIREGYNEDETEYACNPEQRCGSCVGCEAEAALGEMERELGTALSLSPNYRRAYDAERTAREFAEAERDRLARRVEELADALRPFVDEYEFQAADYLAQRVDGEEARVFTARTVELLIEHQRAARNVLAASTGPEGTTE